MGGPIQKNRLFFFFDTEGLRVLLPSPVQVVLPSPQFEAATIANIDSIFGSASASDAFYKQIFSLYNQTPGIAAATPGASPILSAVSTRARVVCSSVRRPPKGDSA